MKTANQVRFARPAAVRTHTTTLLARRRGFTLLELLVVIGVLVLLLMTLLPNLAKSNMSSRSFQCLNNNRQLCSAWRIYADDNNDSMVYSSDNGTWNSYAWTSSHMDFNPNNRANWDISADITIGPLWPYTGRNASIYRCPSDFSYVVVSGVPKTRVRSMSMNFFLGGMAGTYGGWGPPLSNFRLFFKTTDLVAPGPARTFVFLDERSDMINWGNYMTDMSGYPDQPSAYTFSQDMPGLLHDLACGFSFGDGHAELHRWVDPRTTPPLQLETYVISTTPAPDSPDVAWLQAHSTCPK